jgi:hypothetical protein
LTLLEPPSPLILPNSVPLFAILRDHRERRAS